MNFDNFAQNWANTVDSFAYMGKGMLGIFAVTLAIIASIWVLNKLTAPKTKKDSDAK